MNEGKTSGVDIKEDSISQQQTLCNLMWTTWRSLPLDCNHCSKLLVAMHHLQAVPAFPEQRLRPTGKKSNCISLPSVEKSEYLIFKVPFFSLTPAHPTLAFDLVFRVHELMLFFFFCYWVQASSSSKDRIWPGIFAGSLLQRSATVGVSQDPSGTRRSRLRPTWNSHVKKYFRRCDSSKELEPTPETAHGNVLEEFLLYERSFPWSLRVNVTIFIDSVYSLVVTWKEKYYHLKLVLIIILQPSSRDLCSEWEISAHSEIVLLMTRSSFLPVVFWFFSLTE